jgi:hypothetical protein
MSRRSSFVIEFGDEDRGRLESLVRGGTAEHRMVTRARIVLAAADGEEKAVAGPGGVPADAAAVVLNVTVSGTQGSGYVTVFHCGNPTERVDLNYAAGQTIPNAVIAKVSSDGKVCIYTSATVHLLVDVNDYHSG